MGRGADFFPRAAALRQYRRPPSRSNGNTGATAGRLEDAHRIFAGLDVPRYVERTERLAAHLLVSDACSETA